MIHKVKRLPRKPVIRRWYALEKNSKTTYWHWDYTDAKTPCKWSGPHTYRDVLQTPEEWYWTANGIPWFVWTTRKFRKPLPPSLLITHQLS